MSLDASHINAFLQATTAVFDTMLQVPVTFDKPTPITGQTKQDVSGVIGLSGNVSGSVILGFSKETAEGLVEAFAGPGMEFGSADFADAIGELTNMVVGGAKSKFEGLSVSIGCPTVVAAPGHSVVNPSQAARVKIPCHTDVGSFVIEVAFLPDRVEAQSESLKPTIQTGA